MQPKRFFSKIPGAKFIMPDGHEILFMHGHFDFNPAKYEGEVVHIPAMNNQVNPDHGKPKAEVYWSELQHLVNTNNPLIFDQEHLTGVAQPLPPELDPTHNAHSEAEIHKLNSALASVHGRETGDANPGGREAGAPSDVNASTVDHNLQRQIFKPATGPGAAAAAAAAAKARVQSATTAQAQNKTSMS